MKTKTRPATLRELQQALTNLRKRALEKLQPRCRVKSRRRRMSVFRSGAGLDYDRIPLAFLNVQFKKTEPAYEQISEDTAHNFLFGPAVTREESTDQRHVSASNPCGWRIPNEADFAPSSADAIFPLQNMKKVS